MECNKCGAELDFREAFCSKCGELTHRSRPIAEQLGKGAAGLGSAARDIGVELAKLGRKVWSYVRDEANRKQVIAGGAVLLLLAVFMTDNPISNLTSDGFGSAPDGPQLTASGTPDLANYEDVFLGEEVRYQITSTANVRDYPTSEGTQVTHTFEGGETIYAREVMAFDRTSRWFKLTSGGYIWGGNLAGVGSTNKESPGLSNSAFPGALQGRWTDRTSCSDQARHYVEVTGDSMTVDGELFVLEGSPSAPNWPAEFSVYYSGATDIHVTGITVHMSADGRSIAVREVGDQAPLNWVRDDGLLGCR